MKMLKYSMITYINTEWYIAIFRSVISCTSYYTQNKLHGITVEFPKLNVVKVGKPV